MNADTAAHAERRLALLRTLLVTLRSRPNPFYAPRLRAAGIDADLASLDDFIERMPFTTKADLARDQHDHPPYGSNLTFPVERYTRLHQTSSTTGPKPLRWLDTPESWSALLDGWCEVLSAAGATAGDRVFLAFSFGPFIGFWMGFDAANRLGCLTIPGGALNSVLRIKAILANDVTIVCATPTYALRLGEVARAEGLDLARSAVRALIVAGEPGGSTPATRARLEELWPTARVFDHYGMTEVGPVTYQCAEQTETVHVLDEAFLCEIIDPDTGRTHPPDSDTPGELVLTTLTRTACPVLRYRTGDLVRPLPRERCVCSRTTLRFAGGIIGRADDMVQVRGVNLYPSAVDQIVRSVAGIAEYRVEVDTSASLTELTVVIEPGSPSADPAGLCAELERAFRASYNLRIPVTAAPPGTLPRFELKSRRWIKHPQTSSLGS